jgi:hypothetical protein
MDLSFFSSFKRGVFLAACLLACSGAVKAQDTPALTASASSIPDAPDALSIQQQNSSSSSQAQPAQTQPNSGDLEGKQTKRILGIVPNFRSVSVNQKLPPMSVKDKFIGTTEDSFDYSSFIFVGLVAGESMAEKSYPQFHQGAVGYGRYYWHALVDQTDENYMVEFFLPVALHQDPRYYTLGSGGIFKRTGYSFSRVFITRQDNGNAAPNVSEIVGAGAAAGISGLYYPSAYRTWTKTGQRWATNVGLDGITFVFKEFWPDINNKIFHQKD